MIRPTDRVTVAGDSSKARVVSLERVGGIDSIRTIATDGSTDGAQVESARATGVKAVAV